MSEDCKECRVLRAEIERLRAELKTCASMNESLVDESLRLYAEIERLRAVVANDSMEMERLRAGWRQAERERDAALMDNEEVESE